MEKCVEEAARRHWALPDIVDSEVLAKTVIADLTNNYWKPDFDKLTSDDIGVDLRHIAARRRHFKATNNAVLDFSQPRGLHWWNDVRARVEYSGFQPPEATDDAMRGLVDGEDVASDDENAVEHEPEGAAGRGDPEIEEIPQ